MALRKSTREWIRAYAFQSVMIIPAATVELDRLEIPEEESEIMRLANRLRSKLGTAYEPIVSTREKDGRLLVEDPADQRVVRAFRLLAESASSPEEKAKYARIPTRYNGLWHPDLEDFPQGTSLHSWEGGWELVDREGRVLLEGGKPRPPTPVRLAVSPVSPDDDDDDQGRDDGPEVMDDDHAGFEGGP